MMPSLTVAYLRKIRSFVVNKLLAELLECTMRFVMLLDFTNVIVDAAVAGAAVPKTR